MRFVLKQVSGHLRLPEPSNIVMCADCGVLFSTQVYQPFLRLIATIFMAYHSEMRGYALTIACPVCHIESIMVFDVLDEVLIEPKEGIDARFLDIPAVGKYLS